MKEYTQLANSLFDYRTPYELLVAKRYPGASFAVFNVNQFMTDIYHNPTPYLTAPANVTSPYYLCDTTGANCKTSSVSPDHFLWYDELHPSEQTDKAIATEFANVVKGSSKYATYWQ